MRKLFVATFVALVYLSATLPLFGQVTEAEEQLKANTIDPISGWKVGGVAGATLAQTALINWAAGGEKSVAVNGLFSIYANYKKDKIAWDNSLDMGYGVLRKGEEVDFRKTDDKVDLLSKYGREAYKNLYYAGLFNFKTQMATGYNYLSNNDRVKISNAFAPAYLIAAVGIDYKPSSHLSIFAAPITSKFTFVLDSTLSNAGAFGVDKGESMNSEFGGYVRIIYTQDDFKAELLKNVSFTSKLDLFSNYLENPQNIVVNWETLIALKINKYINVNLNLNLIYDDKIKIGKDSNDDGIISESEKKARIQFKEILGLGLSFKF